MGLRIFGLTLFLLCTVPPLFAQSILLEGTVRDRNSYRPIPDVAITVTGKNIGTTTDISGRFSLRLEDLPLNTDLMFRHVSYDELHITLKDLRGKKEVLLQPRIIPLQSAEITGERREDLAHRELPQRVETIEAREFEIRGYVDAGDLLRTDHSVQVDEEISGTKRISIRGGNTDEVIILYDGIRLNSNYSNTFDMSLIDLADIERFEIIKGSNTVLFGSEAFSGVINIVPKEDRDYSLRATQQIGSYDSGIWGLQLFQRYGHMTGSYSVRNGGQKRAFSDMPEYKLTNNSLHHSANVGWTFGGSDGTKNELRAQWRYSSVEYVNERDVENLDDLDQLAGLQYNGSIGGVDDLTLALSWNNLSQDITIRDQAVALARSTAEDAFNVRLEKGWDTGLLDLRFSYQFSSADLDLEDQLLAYNMEPVGVAAARLQRERHGFVGIGKMHGETGSDFFQTFNVDMSLRQDIVTDARVDATLREDSRLDGLFDNHDWSHTLFKFAVNLRGLKEDFLLDVFLTYGNNIKYPTLQQQILTPALLYDNQEYSSLDPERNRSVELGATLAREISSGAVSGWEITGSFFQNSYVNKFRPIASPGIPLMIYDNVDDAQISGLEGSIGVYFFGKKLLAEFGNSRYFISEQAAFPFKSDSKQTLSLSVDHEGYSLQLFHFSESEQIGLLRSTDGGWTEVTLPSFSNLDIHASKHFPIGRLRFFLNVSLRNILNDSETTLSGLAIRDRRYYVTGGVQF
ncbi:TonB-dependent receptor [bacterium]|nr:TonB-dependent receptor [bacterium]